MNFQFFWVKWFLRHVHVHLIAQVRANLGLAQDVRVFSFKICKTMTWPCASCLRRFAQNGYRSPGAQHFSCQFRYYMALVTYACAFRLHGPANFWGRQFSSKFVCHMALMTCPCAFRLRRLAQNEHHTDTHTHTYTPCQETLYRNLLLRSCQNAWGLVWKCCSEILPEDLLHFFFYKDLVRAANMIRALVKTLCKKNCSEMFHTDLLWRFLVTRSLKSLAKRLCVKFLRTTLWLKQWFFSDIFDIRTTAALGVKRRGARPNFATSICENLGRRSCAKSIWQVLYID